MELYKTPVILKIYEALTAIIDGKIKSTDDVNLFHIYSSSGNKFYYVYLEIREGKMIAFSNDNATYYEDYFGYPIIALMFIKKILKYDEKLAKELGGIYWKDLNQKYKIPNTPKYDFDQVAIDLNKGLTKEQNEGISKDLTGGLSKELIDYINELYELIKKMKVYKLLDEELIEKGIPKEPLKGY